MRSKGWMKTDGRDPRVGWRRRGVVAAACAGMVWAAGVAGADAPATAVPPKIYRGQGLSLYDLPALPEGFHHFPYANPGAPKGGTVRLAAEGGFDSLNPFIPKGNAISLEGIVYESLMVESLDESFTMYGLLAESVELPEDRSWITFHLRPEARWQDGVPVTADDVVFTFTNLVSRGWPYYRMYYRAVKKVEKLDERSVRFVLDNQTVNRELPLICGQMPVLPAHYFATNDFTAATMKIPVGSGVYRIKSVEPNRSVVYERDPNYWGRELNVKRGLDNFDIMRVDFYRDAVVMQEAFKSGAFDWMLVASAKEWAVEYNIPEVQKGLIQKEVLKNGRVTSMQGLGFNLRRALFQDARVRRALAYAFDFQWANRTLMYGAYTRCRSYFGNTALEAKELPEGDECAELRELQKMFPDAVPAELFAAEYRAPETESTGDEQAHRRSVRNNLLEARRLLKDAGWENRPGDGRLVHATRKDEQGKPLEFNIEILLVSPGFERVVLPFRLALRRLGIECKVRTVDTSVYQNRMLAFDFDMAVQGWRMSDSPGNEQTDYWSSLHVDQTGSMNLLGIRSPAVDEAVKRLIASPTRKDLEARTRVLDRLLQWGFYCIPTWYFSGDRAVYWDKFCRPERDPNKGTTLTLWWVDRDREMSLAARRAALKKNTPAP